jgi:hypothetical protein
MRCTQRSCSRWFGGAWRLGGLTPNRGRLLSALAVPLLFLTLSFTAASSQAASAPVGQQEAPVELEEGEPPGEQEAPPTEAERQNPAQPVTALHEVPSLRSETSDTYLLSDGAYSQRIATTPINFKAADGIIGKSHSFVYGPEGDEALIAIEEGRFWTPTKAGEPPLKPMIITYRGGEPRNEGLSDTRCDKRSGAGRS